MIDINQIQIGDWVHLKYSGQYGSADEYVRIDGILAKGCENQHGGDGTLWGEGHGNLGGGEDLFPIPLTKELLEKNGFVVSRFNANKFHLKTDDERTHIWYYRSGGEPGVTMQIVKNEYYEDEVLYELPQPYYVHELQHALRLCGLNELADSFKV